MENKLKDIKDFKANERVYTNALVKSATKGMAKNNKPFLDIELSTKAGQITAKVWDVSEDVVETIVANKVVYATGIVSEWNGNLQLKVEYIEPIPNAKISDFVKTAPIPTDVMMDRIKWYALKIQDEEIQKVVTTLLADHEESFQVYPAARGMHHAIHSGLAYHTVTMLEVSEKMCDVYSFLNRDLMYAGVILHDLAKVLEMEAENGSVSGFTRPGTLLGHIVQSVLLIGETGKLLNVDAEKIEVLQHLVASHHGKGEWGSPQPPKMAEALMLHHIDNIDAKMYMVKDAMDQAGGKGTFTEKIRGLENNQFYIY